MRGGKADIRMKHPRMTAMIIAGASIISIGGLLAAQDRYTLKDGNGISFSEFRGYETWPLVSVSQPDDGGGCGTSKVGCIKGILANATMLRAYSEGIPTNGKPVPDGAAFAKIEWLKDRNAASPYGVTVAGAQTEVSFMVKDSKRFPNTNGWGYATFEYDAASRTFKPAKPT